MRITQGGIYVMVQKYGIEGLLVSEKLPIQCYPEKEQAVIGDRQISVFQRVTVEIVAEMVEFRRSVSLIYQA